MRAVIQRVARASVTSEGEPTGSIERGLCVLVGVGRDDDEGDATWLADKVAGLRIFEDDEERMNLSVSDVGGGVLAVSQFTLLGDVRKGKRPSFSTAMEPERANALFERFCARLRELGLVTETGRFRTHMQVDLLNDGPVTILVDSKKAF